MSSEVANSSPSKPNSPLQNEDASGDAFDIESITGQAKSTIVLHPGSSHLRLGRASDPQPLLIPHVIAWRHKNPGQQPIIRESLLSRHKQSGDISNNLNNEALKDINDSIFNYSGRHVCRWEQVSKHNKKVKPEPLPEGCGWSWTDTSKKQSFLIGDDALYIDETDCYDLHWPIVKGQLNVHDGPYGSLSSVISSLETLWRSAIETFLHISPNELSNFRCVLLVPDLYNRHHVKQLVHMLLNQLSFSSILVHQESVCATYGCGIATACVVDVGHEKISICCVEDGISHESTRITLDVGGKDITRVFAHLLQRNSLPYQKFNLDDRMDALLMEELKETFCHIKPDGISPDKQEFHIRRPGQTSLLYPIMLGDETIQAPLSLFFPEIYALNIDGAHVHYSERNPGDSGDPLDEQYLYQTRSKHYDARMTRKNKEAAPLQNSFTDQNIEKMEYENGDYLDEESSQTSCTSKPTELVISAPKSLLRLHDAILWSIGNCPLSYEDELKRRMYSCILVVGGGLAHFDGADLFLHQILKDSIPPSPSKDWITSQLEIVMKPKDQDPSIVVWKGGSVLSCLDSADDCWVTKKEWTTYGLSKLREKCPFVW